MSYKLVFDFTCRMKANVAYTREIMSLQECGYLHGAFRVHNSLFRNKGWRERQCACRIPIMSNITAAILFRN